MKNYNRIHTLKSLLVSTIYCATYSFCNMLYCIIKNISLIMNWQSSERTRVFSVREAPECVMCPLNLTES